MESGWDFHLLNELVGIEKTQNIVDLVRFTNYDKMFWCGNQLMMAHSLLNMPGIWSKLASLK